MRAFETLASTGKNQFIYYAVTILLLIVGSFLFSIPHALAAFAVGLKDGVTLNLDRNLNFVLVTLSFVGTLGGLYLGVAKLHKRTFRGLITAQNRVKPSRIAKAALLWLGIAGLLELLSGMVFGFSHYVDFDLSRFLILLVLSLVVIPIQAGVEELLFRSYLYQGFYSVLKNKYLAVLVCALGFGLLHISNPEVAEYGFWKTMPSYVYMGLFLGALVLLDNSAEIAIGVHIANNLFVCLFVNFEDSALQTDAIFYTDKIDPTVSAIGLLIGSLLFVWLYFKLFQGGAKKADD